MNKINKLILLFSFTLVFVIYPGCKKVTEPSTAVSPDTTTHNYEWTVHTFGTGAGSSYLYDVFAIAEDDIWAVGKITTNEQDSLGNDLDPYNAMHWDGQNWELKLIETEYRGNMTSPPLGSVFAFSSDDIWANSTYPQHGDGQNWELYHLDDMGLNVSPINRCWGTSSSNVYFVGGNGTLVHYNGSDWTKLDSGTEFSIADICGFIDGNFFAVSRKANSLENEFLVYNNGELQRKISNNSNPKNSLWGDAPNNIYAVGAGIFHYNGNTLNMIDWPSNVPQNFMSGIRGTAANNIFVVGHFTFILHYNGNNWFYYEEINNTVTLSAVAVLENDVFAVGLDGLNAFVYHGKKVTN